MSDRPTTIINYLSFAFVFLVAAVAFVLSYNSLWLTAEAYGVPKELSWAWPLLVDFPLVVFSLAVVRASLKGEGAAWPRTLVGVYTVSTVGFNVLHAPDNLTAQIVAIVAPVSLFLSFETLMAMLKSEVKKSAIIQAIAQIEAEMNQKRADLDILEADRLAEIERNGTLRQAEIETSLADRRTQLEALTGQIEQAQQALQRLAAQVEEKRRDIETLDTARLVDIWQTVNHIDPAHLDPDTRRILAAVLKNGGVPQKDIAAWAKVDPKTIQRDIEKCNGLVRR